MNTCLCRRRLILLNGGKFQDEIIYLSAQERKTETSCRSTFGIIKFYKHIITNYWL